MCWYDRKVPGWTSFSAVRCYVVNLLFRGECEPAYDLQTRSISTRDGVGSTISLIPDEAWNFAHEIVRWPIQCPHESLGRQSFPACWLTSLSEKKSAHLDAFHVAHIAFIRGISTDGKIMEIVGANEFLCCGTQICDSVLSNSPSTFSSHVILFRRVGIVPKRVW